jgi:acyl-coenzyme A thioesterase PaaI-like protein
MVVCTAQPNAESSKVDLVRALTEKVPAVRAVGRVLHRGRQVSTAEANLVGHDGTLYAHASTTCIVFDAR